MTCYDLRFPALARSLADADSQVLLVCSSWVPGEHKTEQWLVLNAAPAIENGVYEAGVRQAPPVSGGPSVLVDPWRLSRRTLGWLRVFWRWRFRRRRWTGCGSRSRCSGNGDSRRSSASPLLGRASGSSGGA
ncbi:nitrilase-related carbon-nitrogen hydrolase [Pseudarthrobacter equi]|uniref:nitrilase-related carbon-nitrogen hydrolase n=1 Tax=Pseudarthrobacter equi TaxID=728066 RepID=UPI0028D19A7E|nr:nitrilase-related carbon-nitrogen hydrolase [Pseudarthrobacter equi]